MTHFTIQPLHWHPLYPNRPKTLTAFHQPQILAFTVPRFYDFVNSQKKSKLPINSPIETYHKSITDLSPAYYLTSALFTKRPPFPHSNDAFYNPAPPLAPSLPQPPQNPHSSSPTTNPCLYSSTFLRFCKFTENKQTADKQPH